MKKALIIGVIGSFMFVSAALAASGHAGIHWGKHGISIGGGIHIGMDSVVHHAEDMVSNCKEMNATHPGCDDAKKILDLAKKHVK